MKYNIENRLLLDQIADKWSILILSQICQGPLRFNTLKRSLPGISQKSLTQALRKLERNGILAREVQPTSPITVEYRVTALGLTLKEPFESLFNWARKYAHEVEKAQKEYDENYGNE
ncbi:winged helix-turn-helix transcriptional regulator [Vibrio porteresiae]|uniref:Helix-turn-helix domain-containing protein n=1 Tax=Vibrio porteresiae DSM 19223 TaxID=1123496 RepID=A0ABZ0QII9_9VIBR|nr:helix-turn-helix domain-containing protein [Vibrio porteresiae]WPC75861.1 helix-turn-helix domain-containing protein [Vibrio porteresiae DSM 19223]